MPIINPTGYIHSCKNNGLCHQLSLESMGLFLPDSFIRAGKVVYYSTFGRNFAILGTPEQVRPRNWFAPGAMRYGFKCCMGCHQPFDVFTAMDLNKALGFKPPTLEESMSEMDEALEGFDLLELEG